MLRAGLDLDGELLALACASHSGEPGHVDGVRRILTGAGLDEADLDNTPDLPLGPAAAAAVRAAGAGPSPVLQNCSGKHAAMLAACVSAGWPTAGYRDPAHPLQRLVRETVAELTGVRMSPPSVCRLLREGGMRLSRPQHTITSPDPEYALKRGRSRRPAAA